MPAPCLTSKSSGHRLQWQVRDRSIHHSSFQDHECCGYVLERLSLAFTHNPPASLVQNTAIQCFRRKDAVIFFALNRTQNRSFLLQRLYPQTLQCHQPRCGFLFTLLFSITTARPAYLCAGLAGAVGAHKLHKLLERVLMMVVAYGGVGEVGAGLLDDRRRGEVQG